MVGDTGSTPKEGISFSGLVTFNSGNFALDGSTITSIDGGNIATNTITATQLTTGEIISASAQLGNAVVDTLQVAGNAITISNFTSFSTQSGAGPYTFTSIVSMPYDGDVIVIANLSMFGSTSSGSATFSQYISGTLMGGVTNTGQVLLGLHTLAGSKVLTSGSHTLQVIVSGISGITSPSAKCNFTVLRTLR